MTIFQLMVRQLSEMNVLEYTYAGNKGYVTINASATGRDPFVWWVRITAAMLIAVCELRPLVPALTLQPVVISK